MNPNCEKLEPLLGAYADDELSAADRSSVQAHLADCPECRACLAAFNKIDRLYAAAPCEQPTVGRWRTMIWNVIPRAAVIPLPHREPTAGTQRIPMVISHKRPLRWAAWSAAVIAVAGVVLVSVVILSPTHRLPISLPPDLPMGLSSLSADNTCSILEIDTTAEGYEAVLHLPEDAKSLLLIDIVDAPVDESETS